jgi:hypothetical protein
MAIGAALGRLISSIWGVASEYRFACEMSAVVFGAI